VRCPNCNRQIVSVGLDGKIKIRTNIVVFHKSKDQAIVVCRKCGGDVPIDIHVGEKLQKSITPRLILRKIDIKAK